MIFRMLVVMITGLVVLGCSDIETMQPPPSVSSHSDEPPPPPPGAHDESFIKLPRPLNVTDAKRVLTEATVFAPWGIGYGGRPIQALAINVLIEQTTSRALFNDIYRQAGIPGQLLALCGLQSSDRAQFETLSQALGSSEAEVYTYSGDCTGEAHTAAEIVAEIRVSSICRDIPKSKRKISALCDRAG
jgi:hypothetical protein